jgi:arylsulfatase A-like enzyme
MSKAIPRLALLGVLAIQAAPVEAAPNIVVFLVDDQGWADTSLPHAPSDFYETPNLASLAAQGVSYTEAYASAAICGPSRASLMTGRTPAELGSTLNEPANIDAWETIPEALKGIDGYTTAHVGRWNIQGDPLLHGFDEVAVNLVGIGSAPHGDPKWMASVTTAALDFMAAATPPFYLQVSHFAPHLPLESYPDTLSYFQAKSPGAVHGNAQYASMVRDLDDALGQILAALPSNTFVIYTSDNGGWEKVSSNAPLRGGKGQLLEGGIRVPLVVAGPGVVPGTSGDFIAGWDLKNLIIELAGGVPGPDPAAVWHFPHRSVATNPVSAIRRGNLKLLYWWWGGRQVFDVVVDPGESVALPWGPEAVQMETDLLAYLQSVGAERAPPRPAPTGCGLSGEIALLLSPLWVIRRRRSHGGGPARTRSSPRNRTQEVTT